MHERAASLIRELRLEPHPEGGYYRQTFRSPLRVTRGGDERSALTAIWFLLAAGQHSRWHRVASDEIWTYAEGAPVALSLFDGERVERRLLAPLTSGGTSGGVPYVVVPRLVWQAAEVLGDYALVSCFVAPGFEFADFTLMADDAEERAALGRVDGGMLRLV